MKRFFKVIRIKITCSFQQLIHVMFNSSLMKEGIVTENSQKTSQDYGEMYIDFSNLFQPQHLIKTYPYSDFFLQISESLVNCFVGKVEHNKLLFRLYMELNFFMHWMVWKQGTKECRF